MKLSFLRHSTVLVLALGLAACGGKAKFAVEGNIAGLKYPGLVMSNVGMSDLPVDANATSFRFPNTIEYGTAYDVKVKTNPAHQTCSWDNGTDSAGRQASIRVAVACNVNAFLIGGAVKVIAADGTTKAMTADNLVLINGSNDRITVLKDAATYKFGISIPYATSYGVSVLQQPDGGKLRCTVERATGEMGDAEVTNIDVTCREI